MNRTLRRETDGVVWRSAQAALAQPFQAEFPQQRTAILQTSLELTYHGQNRWGISTPGEPYAYATCLLLGMTPTPNDDRIAYLSVRGSDQVDRFAGRNGVSIVQAVESIRSLGSELDGADPFERAKFVVLLSCNGCEEFGAAEVNSRAKKLSELTGLPVLGQDGLIAVYHRPTSPRPPAIFTVERGAFEVGGPHYKKQGTWRTANKVALDAEQHGLQSKLLKFYEDLARDADRRVVAHQDGNRVNPIQYYVDQIATAEQARLQSDEATTADEIRFLE